MPTCSKKIKINPRKLYWGHLFFAILLLINDTYAQTIEFEWAKSIGGKGNETLIDSDIDKEGNLYLLGTYDGDKDFNSEDKVYKLPLKIGTRNFVEKLNANGQLIWIKYYNETIGGINAKEIAVDNFGNVIISGTFKGTVDFNPDPGPSEVCNLVTNRFPSESSWLETDIFVCKLNSKGKFLWAKSYAAVAHDCIQSLALDKRGNIYLTFNFVGNISFTINDSIKNLVSNFHHGLPIILKLSISGEVNWIKQIEQKGEIYGQLKLYNLLVDDNSNLYIACSIFNQAFFTYANIINDSTSIKDAVFVTKLDSAGNYKWVLPIVNNEKYTSRQDIALDNGGNVIVSGGYNEGVELNLAAQKQYKVKQNERGSYFIKIK